MDDIIGNSNHTNSTSSSSSLIVSPTSPSTSSTSSTSPSSTSSTTPTTSKKELSANSEPYVPSFSLIPNISPQHQQQQQQSSIIIDNASSNKREKLTLENVEHLFVNRFHPKNNIREAIVSTFNSIIYSVADELLNNPTNNNNNNNNNNINQNSYEYLLDNIISMIDQENKYIIKLIKDTKNNNNNNRLNQNNQIIQILKNSNQNNNNSQKPTTLPFEDSESLYQRVILYNLHILSKIAANVITKCEHVQTCLFYLYDECNLTNGGSTTTIGILPSVLTCLAQMVSVVKFQGANLDRLTQVVVTEMKQSDRASLEANLYLLHSTLDQSSLNSLALESSSSSSSLRDIFRKLSSLVYSKIPSIQTRLPPLFKLLIAKQYLDVTQIRKIITISLFKLSDVEDKVKYSYLTLLPKTVSYIDVNSQKNLSSKVHDISLPYKLLLMRSQGTYGQSFSEFFKRIFEWLNGSSTITKEDLTKSLLDQFYYLNIINILSIENPRLDKRKIESIITSSEELIWYWAMWECARYCISNRLKTVFGSGVQTFEIFERIILKLNRERKDFKKIKLMLQFMDSLEKQIFSSAYGSVILPSPSSKEILFFKLNSRVSEDWFSRIRTNLLKASILCSSASDIIRHATLRINDIKSNRFVDPAHLQFELEFCVLHLANAFQQLGETESLIGLSKWVDYLNHVSTTANLINNTHTLSMSDNIKMTQSPTKQQQQQQQQQQLPIISTPWMNGIIQSSKQRYEDSIQSLSPLLSSTDQNSISFPFIAEHIIKSYLDLSDYQEMDQFLIKYKDNLQDSNLAYKDSYLKTLSSFSKNDLESSKPFISECLNINRETNGLLSNLLSIDEIILAIMINQKDGNNSMITDQLIGTSKSFIKECLNVMGLESNTQTFQFISQLKLIDELEYGVNGGIQLTKQQQSQLSNTSQQIMIGYLERLRRVRNHISSTQHRNDLLFYNIPLTEKLIKLSQKTGNYRLCHRLLNTILESHSPISFIEKVKLKFNQGKIGESINDLIKHINHFPDNVTPQIKTKSYLQLIKYSKFDQNNQIDIENYYKKAILNTPENVKVWNNYGDWAFEKQFNLNEQSEKIQYIKVALESYFEYLKFNTDGSGSTIQTTLKIFNILVNHGDQLQETFDKCLQIVSIKPFMDIIPQMFARLGNCSRYSQACIVDILNRVAEEDPNKIVFPTLVGDVQQQSLLATQQLNQPSSLNNSNQSIVNNTYQNYNAQKDHSIQLVKKGLVGKWPLLVSETERLIKGLEDITILWDDSWQQLMEQIHLWLCAHMKDWNIEYAALKKAKVPNLNARLKRKNLSLMQPVLEKIKKLLSTTLLNQTSTPHEKWFASVHYEIINKVVRCIEKQTKPANPFASLQELIQHFALNRLANLDLYSISPQLYDFHPTTIAMPGLGQSQVRLQSVQPTIYLLPTKTKPKKISFVGSDGMSYSYLLKGREDLHLDERIMQMQSIIDQLLMTDKKTGTLRLLRTRSYAVVPLSQTSGLIQWVESAVPLFSIYKNWYRNEAAHKEAQQQQQQQQQQQVQPNRVTVRPIDIFYNKLVPLLGERGISKVHRSDWPKDIMVKVYLELVSETPKWLLSRELWYSSCSTSELFLKTLSFSRSLALMSMVGYMIGLGDRHLDNILIDLKTGEVVHIDYNICFEKGLQLKVPEKVPFRMTQIIEYALGLNGAHGTFTETSIQVLGLLRRNKQTLLNLLETFIYDPLYDWKLKQNEVIMKGAVVGAAGVGDVDVGGVGDEGNENVNNNNKNEDNSDESDGGSDGEEEAGDFNLENIDETLDSDAKQDVLSKGSIQGLTIVNQVKLKLEGTEQKLSVEKQVEMVIREATSIDNLSSMFEGWTPNV